MLNNDGTSEDRVSTVLPGGFWKAALLFSQSKWANYVNEPICKLSQLVNWQAFSDPCKFTEVKKDPRKDLNLTLLRTSPLFATAFDF